MADQQRKVSLIFEANASQAKNEINDLVTSLQKIQATPKSLIDITSIREANKAAQELSNSLRKATDVNTGKIDMTRFSTELSRNNKSLQDYANTLSKVGVKGNQAFTQLARSINNAEVSSVRLTKNMQDFLVTMKNTAKWQISSSLMHGFMGAIQTAYGYAQSLDRSLNDIRIVTGQSSEQMARFAEQANKSAQALSTTTTKYTEAALIFYQQGLGDKAVKERTDAVIKMANVTGEASKDVSSYMTAIWNNFDDGSKSIEYYADVITKLGAATAASSEEIAGGLEKFAAVGNTIGLSYEYATAMLTTIIDKTRQSEDVVGTALKTILARIQGLNLGETLEDGTTLNKYSSALLKVGINIKDATGQLKDMDIILDELGSKWGALGKDTQIALAQVVGGVRQYNQIISLMDNWGAFKGNLSIAENAEGSLNKQANIYAESWEAARNRVTSAAQGIYDAIIDKDVFIQLDGILTKVLNTVEGLVEGFGGMGGAITTVAGIFMSKFAKEVPSVLSGLTQNIAILTGRGQNKALNTQSQLTQTLATKKSEAKTDYEKTQYESLRQISALREQLIAKSGRMSSQEKEAAEALIAQRQAIRDIVDEKARLIQLNEDEVKKQERDVTTRLQERRDNLRETDITAGLQAFEKQRRAGVDTSERIEEAINTNPQEAINFYEDQIQATQEKINVMTKKMWQRYFKLESDAEKQALYDDYEKKKQGYGQDMDYYRGQKEKASKLSSQGINDLKDLGKASAVAQKGLDTLYLAKQKLDKRTGQTGITDIVETLKALKSSSKLSEDALRQIDTALQSVGDGANATETQIEELTQALDQAMTSQNNYSESLQQQRTAMINSMAGEDDDLRERLIQYDEGNTQNYLDKEDNEDIGGEDLPNIEEHMGSWSESITATAGAVSSLYGVILSVQGAWEVFTDEGSTWTEKLGAGIGILTSMLMTFNTVTEAGNAITALVSMYHTRNAVAKTADAAATGAVTVATKANTTAVLANNAALMANPIVAIISVALMALVAIIGAVTAAHKAHTEALNEQAAASKEAADELRNEAQANKELLSSYNSVSKAYEEATASKEELADAALAVARAYEIENAQLLIAQGNYALLNSEIEKAVQAEKLELLKADKQAFDDKKAAVEYEYGALELQAHALQKGSFSSSSGIEWNPISEAEALQQAGVEVVTTIHTVLETTGSAIATTYNENNISETAANMVKPIVDSMNVAGVAAEVAGEQIIESTAQGNAQVVGATVQGYNTAAQVVANSDAGTDLTEASGVLFQTSADAFNDATENVHGSNGAELVTDSAGEIFNETADELSDADEQIAGSNGTQLIVDAEGNLIVTTANGIYAAEAAFSDQVPNLVDAASGFISTMTNSLNGLQKWWYGDYTEQMASYASQAKTLFQLSPDRDMFSIIGQVLGENGEIGYGSGYTAEQFVLSLLGFSASSVDNISSLFGTSESGQAIFESIFGAGSYESFGNQSFADIALYKDSFEQLLKGLNLWNDNIKNLIAPLYDSEGLLRIASEDIDGQYFVSQYDGQIRQTKFLGEDLGYYSENVSQYTYGEGQSTQFLNLVDSQLLGSILAMYNDMNLYRGSDLGMRQEGNTWVGNHQKVVTYTPVTEESFQAGNELTPDAAAGVSGATFKYTLHSSGSREPVQVSLGYEIGDDGGVYLIGPDGKREDTPIYTVPSGESFNSQDAQTQLEAAMTERLAAYGFDGQVQFAQSPFTTEGLQNTSPITTFLDSQTGWAGAGKPIDENGNFNVDNFLTYNAQNKNKLTDVQIVALYKDLYAAIDNDVSAFIDSSGKFHEGLAAELMRFKEEDLLTDDYRDTIGGISGAGILQSFAANDAYQVGLNETSTAYNVINKETGEIVYTLARTVENAMSLGASLNLNGTPEENENAISAFNTDENRKYLQADSDGKLFVSFGEDFELSELDEVLAEINALDTSLLNGDISSSVMSQLQAWAELGTISDELVAGAKDLGFYNSLIAEDSEITLSNVHELKDASATATAGVLKDLGFSDTDIEGLDSGALQFSDKDLIAALRKYGYEDLATAYEVTLEIKDDNLRQEVRAQYDALTPEERTIFLTLDFSVVNTENLEELIEGVRAQVNAAAIDAVVGKDTASDWSKVSTGAEAMSFRDSSGIAWGESIAGLEGNAWYDSIGGQLKTFDEFLAMSYVEQMTYLRNLDMAYNQNYQSIKEGGIQAAQEVRALYQKELDAFNLVLDETNKTTRFNYNGQRYQKNEDGSYSTYDPETQDYTASVADESIIAALNEAYDRATLELPEKIATQDAYIAEQGISINAHISVNSRDLDNFIAEITSKPIEVGTVITVENLDEFRAMFGEGEEGQAAYEQFIADNGFIGSDGSFTFTNENGEENFRQVTMNHYANNPQKLAQYATTSELRSMYNSEEQTLNGQAFSQQEFDLAYSKRFNSEVEDLGLDPDEVERLAEALKELPEYTDATEEELERIAKAQLRWNRSIESGEKNLEEWKKQIKTVTKDGLGDFADSIDDVQDAYEDLLDVAPDSLSDKFMMDPKNLELYEKAINGDTEALKEFQDLAADDIYTIGVDGLGEEISTIVGEAEGEEVEIEVGVTEEAWDNALLGIRADIDAMNADATITPEMSLKDINAKLSELQFSTYEAAQAANQSLAAIGVDADIVEKKVDIPEKSITTKQSGTFTNVKTVDGEEISTETLNIDGESTITEPAHTQSYYVLEGKGFNPGSAPGGAGSRGGRTARPSGRGGGGGRRGGGGGRGREAPRAEKKKDSDKERYHTITNVLEDLTDAYDKVSKASDRAFGKARVKLLEQQEEALVDLMEAQEDYLDEIEANLKKDMDLIKSMDFGVELQFDENGTLLNFEELQNAMWDEYNSHINDKGEVIGMTDEEWKEYEEKWQERMDALAQYEETQDLWKEAQQQLQDYINQIKDVRLEQVTYAVEVDIEASEHSLEILEYLLEKIGDNAWDAAEAIANMGEQAQEYLGDLKVNEDGSTTFVGGQIETYRQGIAGILGNHTTKVGENDTTITQAEIEGFMNGDAAAIEKVKQMGLDGTLTDAEVQSLKDYHSQLLAANQALMDLRDNVHGKVLEAFQQFNEELQEGIDAIVHLGAMMQSYRNIVDIVGKENLGVTNTMLEAIGQAGVENKIDTLGGQKARVDSLRAMIADAEAKAASATTEEDKEKWKENIEEMKKDLADAEEDFMSSWEEALQGIQEQFELAVTNTIETFSDALAGPLAGSLDELQASFDRQNNLAERFLPEYEKIYELNKLNRDITNSINDTDNVKAKQELAKLQEEINTLEAEGTEVSRFQTEDLRRRYELKLAELALEEAKNAKSNVQMARNADGDWSYVYTADEEDVAAAEQTYEDRMFAIQQANAEYINEMQNSLIQAQADMASEIEAIMTDETLSMEEKMQKVNEIKEYYTEMFGYYSDELQYVMDQNGTAFEDTTLSALTGFQDLESYNQNFYDATTAMMTDLDEAYAMWEENTEAAMDAAGTSIDGFADHLSEQTQAMVEDSDEARESVENLGETAVNTFEDITAAVENWVTQYGEKINEVITKNEALALSFKNVLNEWSNFENKDNENPPTENPPADDPGGDDDSGNESDEPEYMGQITIRKGYQYWGYKSPKGGNKNKVKVVNDDRQERTYKFTQMDTSTSRKRVYIPSEKVWVSSYDPDGPKRIKVEKFDTGGYTGSWGSEGRMAMLHEKEIVLNKGDTANLLTAVDMIRQVAKVIDLNAYSSAGFGSSIIGMASGSAGQFEQNVHITAEFPNATDRNEIYAAFTDIVNLASQYANR